MRRVELSELAKEKLIGHIHGDAIIATAIGGVRECERELETMPQPPEIPVTEGELAQLAEVLRRKAEAYDKIAVIVKANPHYQSYQEE